MSGRAGNLATMGGNAWRSGVLGKLVVLALAALLVGQIVVAWFAVTGFERDLAPQLGQKAQTVGHSVAGQIDFAVDKLGIPPRELVEVGEFFDKVLAANPDIAYLAMQGPSSELLFARGLPERIAPGSSATAAGYIDSSFPIAAGTLHVGVKSEYVRDRLSDILYEIITVIGISWLVALEFFVFFVNVRVSGPLQRLDAAFREGAAGTFANRIALRTRDEIGRAIACFNRISRDLLQRYEDFRAEAREIQNAQIDEGVTRRIEAECRRIDGRYRFEGGGAERPRSAMHIRAPLFLFIFSEELSRSFLPLFVARFSPDTAFISNELLIGLPITLFMLAAAIVTPFGAGLADRLGARRTFLIGLVPAIAGYAGTFLAQGYYDLILWRALSGVGYGIIFIASQAWVAQNTDDRRRAQGMAVFVGAVFAGTVCGPSIGGILADRIGFAGTFLISAGLAAVAGLIVYQVLDNAVRRTEATPATLGLAEWKMLLRDGRFLAVAVFAAVPGKLVLSGFLFYLVPLYMTELGNAQAAIGWSIMLYGAATIAFTPLAARFADSSGRYPLLVAVGGALAGLGCLAILVEDFAGGATGAVVVAIVALGVGHALSLTSQLAIVLEVADTLRNAMGPASVIGAYRLLERAGIMLGPIAAAVLASGFGYRGAVIGIGLIVLGFFALYLIAMAGRMRRLQGKRFA